jgi:multidrug efflux pump subunit AcrA (membrane-fusion protein)
LLVPGLFVRGRIPLATHEQAILIPDAAVTTDQARRVVYVVGPENRVVAKPVVLGPLSDGLRVIAEGLSPDDTVIIRGLQRVQPGTPVEPQQGKIEGKPAASG